MFTTYFRAAGGTFDGGLREGRPPRDGTPFAVMQSAPLYDIVRDVNKLSNNVMARQIFLTLATTKHPPPATTALATDVVQQWLRERKIPVPGLVIENGSGLSRRERISANGLARLLASADRSPVREEFVSSLAVAAMDGTVQKRFRDGTVAGQALLKTGSLEGVRALAGYVIDAARPALHRDGDHQPPERGARRAGARLPRAVGLPGSGTLGSRAAALNGFDAIVEAKIAQAQRDGEFDRLPGAGKPLVFDDDRMIPEDLRMAYRVLRNAGYVPEEIEARKEAASLRALVAAAASEDDRRRALARLSLLEARLEASGRSLPRASGYAALLAARFARSD